VIEMQSELLKFLEKMITIRLFEEELIKTNSVNPIHGTLHLYIGQEAVAVGACEALEPSDLVVSNHRGHGHFIAKGGDLEKILSEICGLESGYCQGRGGTQHMADFSIGFLGSNGITAGQIPIATGAAFASQKRQTKQVVLCFFGDGAANEGVCHEAMNLAAVFKLPIIYVCENNLYAMSTPFHKAFAINSISSRAVAYGMPGETVDGMDVIAVNNAVSKAVILARTGGGPSLIECLTYRFVGHSLNDTLEYRTREEELIWKNRDPIKALWIELLEKGISQTVLESISDSVAMNILRVFSHINSRRERD